MAKYLTLNDFEANDRTVLVRVDFNSPIDPETKKILDDSRIRVHGESTIKELSDKGARVVILAHQGRKGDPDFTSLKEHSEILSQLLGKPVKYVDDICGQKAKKAIEDLRNGQIAVLENVRMFPTETKEGTPEEHARTELVKSLAPLADFFVGDAFAAAHRSHISIVGFTAVLPSCAGRVMERELKSLTRVLERPERPCIFILGGAKADDSLDVCRYVLEKGIADQILTGGVVGQVFLVARDVDLGKPNMDFLQKQNVVSLATGTKKLLEKYTQRIKTPMDVAVDASGARKEMLTAEMPTIYSILDIGERTAEDYAKGIRCAKTIVVSGPMGVYENKEFESGTRHVFTEIANSEAYSLAGGGHTIGALQKFGLLGRISYASTGGGALIEFLMGRKLPGVAALEKAAEITP